MNPLPDRLASLVSALEAGEPIAQVDLDRLAALQGLDLARAGRLFVVEMARRDEQLTEVIRDGQ